MPNEKIPRSQFEAARDAWSVVVTQGTNAEVTYWPRLLIRSGLLYPLPQVTGSPEIANVMQPDGLADPELVGIVPLPEVTLSPDEFAAIPGAVAFIESLHVALSVKLAAATAPPPEPPPSVIL